MPATERIIVEDYKSSKNSYLIYLVHLATYKFCIDYIGEKKILDYGCGSGYGTALISERCLHAVGVDIASDAIDYAKAHYSHPNLSYLAVNKADDTALPFSESSFDVVLSFQVIEHIQDVSSYLQEIERVLVPGGLVIIATPDRSSRLFSFQKPWNMWHVKEYSRRQLCSVLGEFFVNVNIKQIGGEKGILKLELDRTRKLKWIMLPFTLPFIPEHFRITCLRFLKRLEEKISPHSSNPIKPNFDETALSISENEKHGIDFIAIAQKK